MAATTPLERALAALEQQLGPNYWRGSSSGSHVERDWDRGDDLPAEQLSTENADRAVLATYDHRGEG